MKRFRCLRPFALLLSLLMLIYAFPFSTTALTTTDASDIAAEPTNDIGASLSDIIDTEAISGVREVTDLREENVKHFALPDGTYTAITYANPVHRKDENGIWQDIDNTLSMKAVKNKERYATSDMRVSFSKAFSEGEALFALTENGYTIQMAPLSWGSNTGTSVMALTPSENKTVTVTNTEKRIETQRFDTIEEAAAVNNKSSIVYENVKTNTDLEYVLDGNDVKENIIVKSMGGSYVYRFTLSLTGLSAALLPSGDISLTDSETGAQKYTIPAPYMYDANGTLSHDVHYTLTPAGSGSYTLTVTASPEWINAEDRAFPVVIDPTVKNTTQIFDTYILSTAPDSNYETETYLSVNDNTILYFLWAYPDIPDNATITNASLHIKPVNLNSGVVTLGAYQMLESILPYSITWNSAAAMTNFGMASSPLCTVTLREVGAYTSINLTTFVRQWYANPSSNYGIALKKLGVSSYTALLYSCDTGSDNQAYFSVTYRLFEDGTYFIQNVATGKYLALAGPSASEGAYIQQQDFLGEDHLRWQLTHDSSGNIKIQSLYSDRYITTNSASSSVTQTQTLNDYSSWAFYQTDSGNYRIFCTAFPLRAYNTICARSDTNGVYMAKYTDDNGSYDEWKLYHCKYTYNVHHYYDQGYNIRFSNALENINSYQIICSKILFELFGVTINSNISNYTSCADSCTGTPPSLIHTTTTCSHSSTNHKTSANIRQDIISQFGSGSTVLSRVAWTGHLLDSRSSNSSSSSHTIVMTIGMVTDSSNNNLSAEIIRYERIYTLLHESSHQLGAPDHYCYDKNSSNCNNPSNDCWRCDRGLAAEPECLMSYRMNDLETKLNNGTIDTIYCSQCMSSTHSKGILTHLENHH